MSPQDQNQKLRLKVEAELFALEGVQAVKVMDAVVKVWSSKPELVPKWMYGRVVEVYYTPPVKPLAYIGLEPVEAVMEERTGKWRPAPGGVSIGEYRITAGTLGSRVYDLDAKKLILSNFHILTPYGEVETPIYQPGPKDGGTSADTIALSKRYIPIRFNDMAAENKADAAVAIPNKQEDLRDDIVDVGVIEEVTNVTIDDLIAKSGRSCAFVENKRVLETDVTVKVTGYPQGYAAYVDQIVTEPILIPGDSGSVGLKGKNVFGLGFAGSDEISVFSPIKYVIGGLSVSFSEPEVSDVRKYLLYSAIIGAPVGMVGAVSYGTARREKEWLK